MAGKTKDVSKYRYSEGFNIDPRMRAADCYGLRTTILAPALFPS